MCIRDSLGLDRLFREEETFVTRPTRPVRRNLEQAFIEYITTLDNNSSARSNAERFLNTLIYDLMDNSNNIVNISIPNPPGLNNIPDSNEENFDEMPELEPVSGSDMSIDSDDYMPELE